MVDDTVSLLQALAPLIAGPILVEMFPSLHPHTSPREPPVLHTQVLWSALPPGGLSCFADSGVRFLLGHLLAVHPLASCFTSLSFLHVAPLK